MPSSPLPFRFGLQLRGTDAEELRAKARTAEAAGFDVIHVPDHVDDAWSPLMALAAIASITEKIRLCPLVLNNDFHHPVHLARELASLDHLSGGRVELGIGAGHSFTEYAAIGAQFDPPAVRKARMGEAIEILRGLLDGEEVTYAGSHYHLRGARTRRSYQPHLPFLIGVNGRAALAHGAQHADTIGLTMLGRTLADGQSHEPRWEADRLDRTIAHIAESSRGRDQPPELNALVQRIIVTSDRRAAAADIVARGLVTNTDDVLSTPFLAIGTHDEIAEHLVACRARWGISYYSVRDVEPFAPVIERLR